MVQVFLARRWFYKSLYSSRVILVRQWFSGLILNSSSVILSEQFLSSNSNSRCLDHINLFFSEKAVSSQLDNCTNRSMRENNIHHTSEIHWSYFHLSPLQRVVISPPVVPVYTISKRGVTTMKIEAIQVGMVTCIVPPRTPVLPGTVST